MMTRKHMPTAKIQSSTFIRNMGWERVSLLLPPLLGVLKKGLLGVCITAPKERKWLKGNKQSPQPAPSLCCAVWPKLEKRWKSLMRKICKLKDYIAVFVTFCYLREGSCQRRRWQNDSAMFWWWWRRRCHGVSMFHGYASRKLNFRININNNSTRRTQTTSFRGSPIFGNERQPPAWPAVSCRTNERESSWDNEVLRS